MPVYLCFLYALLAPVRRWLSSMTLLLALALPLAARPPHYALPTPENPVALLPSGRGTYLITEHSVYELAGRQLVRRYQSALPVRCALAADSGGLWLGTSQALLHLRPRHGAGFWLARAQPLPIAGPAPVTMLLRDASGILWVGLGGYGAYQLVGQELRSNLRIPAITAGVARSDSSVWIGTNLGLHRYQHGAWTRYNEEGVANHEIPDNLVEKLLPDNAGNLWVLMSDALTVFEGTGQAGGGHLPTVRYLGQPGNEVYSVAYLPGRGYLFATAMGLLLLPNQPAGELAHFEATTDRVETPQVLVPLAGPRGQTIKPHLLCIDARGRLWVAGPTGASVWRVEDLQPVAPALPAHSQS